MKKILVLILAVACALCLAFALAGCSTNKDIQGTYYLFVDEQYFESDYYILEKDTWQDASGMGGRYEVKDGNITFYMDFFGEEVPWMTGTVGNGKLTLKGMGGSLEYYKEGCAHIHEFIVMNFKPATCTVQGQIIKVCSCGEHVTETIPIDKNAHYMSGSDPKCTECGITLATELNITELDDYSSLISGNPVDGSITVPIYYNNKPLTSIGESAFSGCTNLENVIIPSSVTSIGEYAFSGCTAEIQWGDNPSIKEIGQYAFRGYLGTSITIPDSVTSIGSYAFGDCTAEIKWGDNPSIKEIGENAFSAYKGTSISIPNGVTSIGRYAFSYCESLESITIPDSVTSIGYWAFQECKNLESVYITDIAAWCNIDFDGPHYPLEYAHNLYLGGNLVTDVSIPQGVTRIPTYAFSRTSLKSITIPNSVTSIGESAFEDCTKLTSINFDDKSQLASIGDYAFRSCTSLESVTIPDNVTYVDGSAFTSCTSLESITVMDNNTAYASQDGILYNKDKTELIRVPQTKTSITIPNSVTSIGDWAFESCTGLTSLTIPNGVTSIGESAFEDCTKLTSINFDDKSQLASIGDYAFRSCTSLESVTIPNGVTSIGSQAFIGCTSLESITIPNGVTSIGSQAFTSCTSLESITIPDSVTSIGTNAFDSCYHLTSVKFENPNGWYRAKDTSATSGEDISSEDLQNTETAATYLKDTYKYYYWKRKTA